MARRHRGWFDPRSKRWFARLGEVDSETGRRRAVLLRGLDGAPVPPGDAKGAAAAVRRILDAQDQPEAARTTAEVCSAYLDWQQAQNAAQRTLDDHHHRLTKWCNFAYRGQAIGNLPAVSIGPVHLWAFDDQPDRRHVYLSVLACWRWAARPVQGRDPIAYLPANPLAGLERPPSGRREVWADWPTAGKIGRLAWRWARTDDPTRGRAAQVDRFRMAVALLLVVYTGARPEEVAGLDWSEVHWEASTIAVSPDRDKRRRKGKPPRVGRWIVVPPRLLKILAYVRRLGFATPWPIHGGPAFAAWWRKSLAPALKTLGYELPPGLTLYGLRHGRIHRRVVVQNVPPEVAALEFGTSAAAIRAHYLHPGEADVVRAAKRLCSDYAATMRQPPASSRRSTSP